MKYINELPEKWYVEVTEESKGILGKWRISGGLQGRAYGYCNQDEGYWTQYKPEGVEISLVDFKRLVLKEEITYEIY